MNWALPSLRINRGPLFGSALTLILGLILVWLSWPSKLQIPVAGAGPHDWNHNSFWAYPWGKSVVHKGIDIFAPHGTPVVAASSGLVLYQGEIPQGGVVVLVLGPQLRLHYYAHLASSVVHSGQLVIQGTTLGRVGASGNAKGKAPHLHYSLVTLIPYPWRWDDSRQGWKKIFYLNPDPLLRQVESHAVAPRPD